MYLHKYFEKKVSFCTKNGGFLNNYLLVLEDIFITRNDEVKSKAIFERGMIALHDGTDILAIIWKFYGEK